jgi:hypothetical protein
VEALAPIILLPGLIMMGIWFSLVVLAFSAYYRGRGIERAAWAIVSQLQAMRREEHDPVQEAQGRGRREVPAPTGMISTSMFGR